MTQAKKKYSRNLAHSRKMARERSLQALYQWQLNQAPSVTIIKQFMESQDMRRADEDYFKHLVQSTIQQSARLDLTIAPLCDTDLEKLDPIEHSILRLSVFELSACLETPYKVVVNEGIELAKKYGGEQSHKFINGVLDKAARSLRADEIDK